MPEDNENASIPDDAEEDIPFPGGPSSEDVSESDGDGHKTVLEHAKNSRNRSREAAQLVDWNLKNIAALGIVAFCLIMIAAFAGIQFGWPGADGGDAVSEGF